MKYSHRKTGPTSKVVTAMRNARRIRQLALVRVVPRAGLLPQHLATQREARLHGIAAEGRHATGRRVLAGRNDLHHEARQGRMRGNIQLSIRKNG